jgi:hypothetical protein
MQLGRESSPAFAVVGLARRGSHTNGPENTMRRWARPEVRKSSPTSSGSASSWPSVNCTARPAASESPADDRETGGRPRPRPSLVRAAGPEWQKTLRALNEQVRASGDEARRAIHEQAQQASGASARLAEAVSVAIPRALAQAAGGTRQAPARGVPAELARPGRRRLRPRLRSRPRRRPLPGLGPEHRRRTPDTGRAGSARARPGPRRGADRRPPRRRASNSRRSAIASVHRAGGDSGPPHVVRGVVLRPRICSISVHVSGAAPRVPRLAPSGGG